MGPGPSAATRPRPGHGLGAPGGAGGGRGPSALMPGPRRPARGWRLGSGGRSAGVAARGPDCRRGLRAGSVEARTIRSAPLLVSPLLSSALGSSSPQLRSALLPGSSPPAPALRPPPLSALPPAARSGAHVTSANEHAPRGPRSPPRHTRPRTLRARGARPPRPCAPPPAHGAGRTAGPWGGGRRPAGGEDSLLLPPPGAWPGAGARGPCALREEVSACVPAPRRRRSRLKLLSPSGRPDGGREVAGSAVPSQSPRVFAPALQVGGRVVPQVAAQLRSALVCGGEGEPRVCHWRSFLSETHALRRPRLLAFGLQSCNLARAGARGWNPS